MRGRHFSWKNFGKFVGYILTILFVMWFCWSFIDVVAHNEKRFEYPSKYNMFVLYCELLESSTK